MERAAGHSLRRQWRQDKARYAHSVPGSPLPRAGRIQWFGVLVDHG
jgi:hypothetical protein